MKYRREIDGLRAVAVIPVILFHADFAVFSGGYVGVDVFFVISGYLITTLILTEKLENRFSLLNFYERRARRILPALLFVVLCTIPPAIFFMVPFQLEEFSASIIATALFSSNIYFWIESGYFAQASDEIPLLHTWSLAVEEQYYLLFPLFILIVWRFGLRTIAILTAAGAVVSFGLAEWASEEHPTANFYLLPTRAWELFLGGLVAMYLKRRSIQPRPANDLASIAGFLLIVLSIFLYDEETPYPSAYALAPVLGTVLLIVFATAGSRINRILGWGPLVGIGLVSYSAYLWHQPLFAFARISQIGEPSKLTMLSLSGVAMVLALLTWYAIENPARNRNSIRLPRLAVGLSVWALGIIAIGLAGTAMKGLEAHRPEQERLLAKTAVPSPFRETCHTEGVRYLKPQSACRYFGKNVTWAVLGDSHGVELSYALADLLKKRNEGLIQLTFSACVPALTFKSRVPGCTTWTREAVEFLTQSEPNVQNIIIVYRYPTNPPERQVLALQEMVRRLQAAHKTVFLLSPIPELDSHVSKYFRFLSPEGDVPGVTLSRYQGDHQEILEVLQKLDSEQNVVLVDSTDALCDSSQCAVVSDETSLYFDEHHISITGAARVAELILRSLPNKI